MHVVADAVTSIFAIIALIFGKYLGWDFLDAALGIVGSILVAKWALSLMQETGKTLLDAEMDHHVVDEIREVLAELLWDDRPHKTALSNLRTLLAGVRRVLGPVLVEQAFAEAGNAGVDEIIRTPPSEEILLNPWLLGTDQTERELTVDAPAGAIVIDPPQQLSPVDLLLMLDAWLPWADARAALDGWAGGVYTSYVRSGTVCLTGVVSFDQTATPFADAITAWAAAAGSDTTPVTIVNDVTFEACSRGNSAAEPPTPIIAPLSALLVERDVITLAGSDPSAAEIADYQCVAATMIDDPLLAPILLLETLDENQQALFAWQSTIAANECGVPPLRAAP